MFKTETNLVRCSYCFQVYSIDEIPAVPKGDYVHCPGCKTATLIPLYTTSGSEGKVLFKRMAEPAEKTVKAPSTLTADRDVDHYLDQELRSYQMAASAHIYKGAFVGMTPSGYVRPLVAGDKFMGIAYEKMGHKCVADGGISVRVYTLGDFGLSLSFADMEDIGKPVFALTDKLLTFACEGYTYVGWIQDIVSAGEIVLRLDTSAVGWRVFQRPQNEDPGAKPPE